MAAPVYVLTDIGESVVTPRWALMSKEDGGLGMKPTTAHVYGEVVRASIGSPGNALSCTVQSLCTFLGCAERSVRSALKELEEGSYIVRVGQRKNRQGKSSACWRVVEERYYEARLTFEGHWQDEIIAAKAEGRQILSSCGEPVDYKTALMFAGGDVRDLRDDVDELFELLWARTDNRNAKQACASAFRRLVREGHDPGDVLAAWEEAQEQARRAGRPESKMPNFARWALGTAAGVVCAEAMLSRVRSEKGTKERKAAYAAMVAEDYGGAGRLDERLRALVERAAEDGEAASAALAAPLRDVLDGLLDEYMAGQKEAPDRPRPVRRE